MRKNNHPKADMMLAEDFAKRSKADNTELAYRKDLDRFIQWGGTIPSTPEQVGAYLTEHASTHKVATLARWMASISIAHQRAGIQESPTSNIFVKDVLDGIKRQYGTKKRRVSPITTEELCGIVDHIEGKTLVDIRDKALCLMQFFGAMRRSEATALEVADIRFESRGMWVDLGQTKTDQAGEESEIAIESADNKKYCAVAALKAWLQAAGIAKGAIFRGINKHGQISENALSHQGLVNIIKARALKAGLDPSLFSGHSMRRGFATSAAIADKPYHKIREITRHKSNEMLMTYIDDAEKFKNNAGKLL
jgi:integrase